MGKKRQAKPSPARARDKTGRSTRTRAKGSRKAAPPKLERELVEQAVEKLADPTAADADTQARILASVADPKQQRLTVEERCELIGISRSTWYRHLSDDPSFAVRYHAACRMALADQVGPVLEALASSALMPGKDGHADRKLFLELTGHYQQSAKVQIEAEGSGKVAAEMTDEQLLLACEGRPDLLPVGLLRRLGRDPDATFDKEQAAAVPEPDEPSTRKRRR